MVLEIEKLKKIKKAIIMSSQLSVKVGATTVNLPLNGTDAQIADVLTRYAAIRGLDASGTVAERLTRLLESIRDDIKLLAKRRQADDLRAANEATIGITVDSDNPL